jgi:hypothetical protein
MKMSLNDSICVKEGTYNGRGARDGSDVRVVDQENDSWEAVIRW